MAVLRWQLAGMRVVLVTVMPKDPWHVDFGGKCQGVALWLDAVLDRNLVIEHGNGKSPCFIAEYDIYIITSKLYENCEYKMGVVHFRRFSSW